MAQQNRFTGQLTTMVFVPLTTGQPVIVSNDYTEVSMEFQTVIEDKTAGSDTDKSFNATLDEGKATLKFWGTAEQGAIVEATLKNRSAGNFFVYPKGQLAGKPVIAFPVIVTRFKEDIKSDKNVTVEIEMVKSGAMIQPIGALQ